MEADRQEEELYDVEEAAAEDLESEPSSAARAALLASAQNVLIVLCGVRCCWLLHHSDHRVCCRLA